MLEEQASQTSHTTVFLLSVYYHKILLFFSEIQHVTTNQNMKTNQWQEDNERHVGGWNSSGARRGHADRGCRTCFKLFSSSHVANSSWCCGSEVMWLHLNTSSLHMFSSSTRLVNMQWSRLNEISYDDELLSLQHLLNSSIKFNRKKKPIYSICDIKTRWRWISLSSAGRDAIGFKYTTQQIDWIPEIFRKFCPLSILKVGKAIKLFGSFYSW